MSLSFLYGKGELDLQYSPGHGDTNHGTQHTGCEYPTATEMPGAAFASLGKVPLPEPSPDTSCS